MNPEWFYSLGDSRQGPVTEDELKRLAADGSLKPTDLVWKDGMPDWVEARTIGTLFPQTPHPSAEDDDGPARRRADDYDRPRSRSRDDDRPRRRSDEEDDRPRSRRDYDDRDDYDDVRRRRFQKPGQIQAVGIMLLIGGILGTITGLGLLGYAGMIGIAGAGAGVPSCLCCLWPGMYLELIYGILAIVRGSKMLGENDSRTPPTTLAVLAILCILNGDIINCVLGIVCLVMLNDESVGAYYRRRNI